VIQNLTATAYAEIMMLGDNKAELAAFLVERLSDSQLEEAILAELSNGEFYHLVFEKFSDRLDEEEISGLSEEQIAKLIIKDLTEAELAELLVDNLGDEGKKRVLLKYFGKEDLKQLVEAEYTEELARYLDELFPTALHYDPSFSGSSAIEDEFKNKVNAFVVKYVDLDGDNRKDSDEYKVTPR